MINIDLTNLVFLVHIVSCDTLFFPLQYKLTQYKLTRSLHMKVGTQEHGGAGTADPKLKQPEHLRACPTCNPAMSPTYQKNPVPAPAPALVTLNGKNSEEPTELIMNKAI